MWITIADETGEEKRMTMVISLKASSLEPINGSSAHYKEFHTIQEVSVPRN